MLLKAIPMEETMRSRQFQLGFRLLAVLLALGLVAAACGDDAEDTSAADAAALEQARAETATAQAAAEAAAAAAADAQAALEAAIADAGADSEAVAQLEADLAAAQEAEAEAKAAAEAAMAAAEPVEEAMPELSGKLVWWSDWTIEQTEAFIDAFNEVHPGVQVEYTRSDDAEMFDRFMTESEAGTIDSDIVIIGWDGFSRIWESLGYLHAFDSPNKGNIPVRPASSHRAPGTPTGPCSRASATTPSGSRNSVSTRWTAGSIWPTRSTRTRSSCRTSSRWAAAPTT